MMELKDFVSRTLTDIAEGVATGAKAAAEFGAVVNPKSATLGGELRHADETQIEFTIGLTVTDAASAKGGIGVVAGIFAVGARGETNEVSASTTHIKFAVPVILPSQSRK